MKRNVTINRSFAASVTLMAMATFMLLRSPSALYEWWTRSMVRLAGFRTRSLALEDGELCYRECGEGTPVLLLHGFGGNGLLNWYGQMVGLSKSFRVIVPDLLWFGESHAERSPSLLAQGEALGRLLAKLELSDVQVVGISYGGWVALELARQAPERVGRLVLIDSPGTEYEEADMADMLRRADAPSPHELFVPGCARDVERVSRLVCNNLPPIPEFVLEDIRRHYYAGREDALTALMHDLVQGIHDHKSRFHGVTLAPAVLIWGEDDRVFPLDLGRKLAARLGAPIYVVPRVGHNLPVEVPKTMLRLLHNILAAPQADMA